MTDSELMRIYGLIPSDRYITRHELCVLSGFNDRKVRDIINTLRKNPDTLVISSSSMKGYKRPESVDELRMCRNEFKSREQELHDSVRVFDEAIRKWDFRNGTVQLYLDFSA